MMERVTARGRKTTPEQILRKEFSSLINVGAAVDALFTGAAMTSAMGVGNLKFRAPVMSELIKREAVARFLLEHMNGSMLVLRDGSGGTRVYVSAGMVREVPVPPAIAAEMGGVIAASEGWAGHLDDEGGHVVDLTAPSPGPHYNVNLLLGNRIGFPHALQTTPKSVVDRLGRGNFRSHAATQVLSTRWDMRPEENGFPANRQFYLAEGCKKIFYSAQPNHPNIASAVCTHLQNRTVIRYETRCGLTVERTIFIVPQRAGEPLAVEAQQIRIVNRSGRKRSLRLVYTGMFGTSADHAVFEDVVYSNVIMQARILRQGGGVAVISPDYYPEYAREDVRFHTMLVYGEGGPAFPDEFSANYNDFVGNGTLEDPEGICRLSNNLYRKGPGFFALGCALALEPGRERVVGNFTGLVSKRANPQFSDDSLEREAGALILRFSDPAELGRTLDAVRAFGTEYARFMQVASGDLAFDTYFNRNLPFQVLYQTFVSRSCCQTQKGHREIGFREIQDLFASMYYLTGMGKADFVRELIGQWSARVFEFGFAYHNFYWAGKEPGMWSDDALWLIQAVYRYVTLTGDLSVLGERCEIAGTSPVKARTVYETLLAILRYSGEISVGRHGMPLLDRADWNDCLSLDNNYLNGIEKEAAYRKQLEAGGEFGQPFDSDYSESVMNAFLLKLALDETAELAHMRGDQAVYSKLAALSEKLQAAIQTHAWKEDFFARVLLNRYKHGEFTYMGAKGDGLSADPAIDGTYFLNSFNWSILAGSANEEQVSVMLDSLEKYLKTPYGIKLCSPADMEKLAHGTATGHYFPGDRENGAVFKHASMMAAAAMVKAAKEVRDGALAARLARLAYWMIDLTLPYRTLEHPFDTCGNPRFCTQYNNSDTGENIGPMLSGTATWLNLTLVSAFGVEISGDGIRLDPVLREEQESLALSMNTGKAEYRIAIRKPKGFRRCRDGGCAVELDGVTMQGNLIPVFEDGELHVVNVMFR